MVDLFCGRGGWTKGFLAHGWRCIGIDLFPQPDYPAEFIQADIAHLIELPLADFYCCSSPCENFSLFKLKMFHKNPKWPWMGISLFGYARQLIEATGKPFIMENVSGAEAFVGKADYHFGPFYVWGNCLSRGWPWPVEFKKLRKGIDLGSSKAVKGMSREEIKAYRKQFGIMQSGSKSPERKASTAKAAEIPIALASHVAQMACAL
jgi:hypothetical protein